MDNNSFFNGQYETLQEPPIPNQSNYNMMVDPPKKGKFKTVFIVFITAILSGLVGSAGTLFGYKYIVKSGNQQPAQQEVSNVTKIEKEVTINDSGISDAVEKVYDSVVIVKNYVNDKLHATGTGFVYKRNNNKYFLITNQHVIDGGTKISVVFTNGEEVDVQVKNSDKYADIAVLSFVSTKDYQVSDIGSSANMKLGDTVFAIGSPLDSNIFSWSVTRGILSGKDREVAVSTNNNSNSADWIMLVLQTDAAINSGNSGGPLCNSNGEVIGVTNMKLVDSSVEGMGFAIPIEEATRYAEAVINGEDTSRPYIGLSMVDANNSQYAYNYGIAPQDGVLVASVIADSPADKAGLQNGDVIIAMNDVKVTNVASLRYQLYKYKVGETISVKYLRNGKEYNTKMTLEASK